MRQLRLLLLLVPVLAAVLATSAASAAPTAVLVDTSRSVSPARFAEMKATLSDLVPELAARGPVALYAFNDEPVQVVDFTSDAGALRTGLEGLQQGGNFTLLHDCLFGAVKAIEARKEPGVVLLVSDGRDENSAVTLEDGASRAAQAHVAVVTVGLGAAVDERTMRRIAVLTGGRYAGILPAAGSALSGAFRETEAALQPFPAPPAPPKPEPAPVHPAPPPAPATNLVPYFLALLVVGVLSLALLAVLLLRRTKKPVADACVKCGRTLNSWETECPVCLAQSLSITHPGVEPQTPAAAPLPDIDPALTKKGPSSEELDHTMVLDEVPVLVLRRPNHPSRMFQLPPDQPVSVGRDKVNTIQVADQTLSGQHFRIIPKDGVFFLADLQSTNGTALDGQRVTLKELKPGATIQAGQCEFTFRMEQKRLN